MAKKPDELMPFEGSINNTTLSEEEARNEFEDLDDPYRYFGDYLGQRQREIASDNAETSRLDRQLGRAVGKNVPYMQTSPGEPWNETLGTPLEYQEDQSLPSPASEQPKTDIGSMVQRLSARQSMRQPSSLESLAAPKTAQQESDYLKQFKDAQEAAKQQTALANVMDASQGFLKSGLMWGGVSPDEANKVITNEGYQRLREQAAKAPEAVTAQMGVESAADKLRQEKQMKDPASEVSQRYRDIAAKSGITVPENATAASLEKVFPYLFRARELEEARTARTEQNALLREAKNEEKNKERELRLVEKFRADDVAKQKDMIDSAYRNIKAISSNKDKGGTSDTALIYSYIKMLDPGSVVREGEIALQRQAADWTGRLGITADRFISGRFLTDRQRKDILAETERLYKEKSVQYTDKLNQFKKQMKGYGLDPNRALGAYEIPTSDEQKQTSTKKAQKAKPVPGSVVKVGNKSYRVAKDGDTLEEI